MSRKKRKTDSRPLALRIRSWVAVRAHDKSGAGPHGGTKKQRNKRDRRAHKRVHDWGDKLGDDRRIT